MEEQDNPMKLNSLKPLKQIENPQEKSNRTEVLVQETPNPLLSNQKVINEEIKKEIDKEKDSLKHLEPNSCASYEIEVDRARVRVEIKKVGHEFIYNLVIPPVSPATSTLLNEIRNELVSATTVGMREILDPNAFDAIKNRFMQESEQLLKEVLPNIEQSAKDFLLGKLIHQMLGLGSIEFLVNDLNLEEIVIQSSKEPIRVYHKSFGWVKTNITIEKEEEIINYSNIIARRTGRQINVLSPLLDAHLVSGDRVNSILYPISTKGNTITIRKFARDPYTIIDLIKNKTCDIDIAVMLWLAIEYEMNILFSGGTASGKTSILNACMPFIPPNHRIISVEDTRELTLPDFLYWTPLVTRSPNAEGKGEVSMLDLLVNSLRMRPDRIILGEMRRKEEATVLFEAMHTGHSVCATLHADSAPETISRLINPPLSVPPNLLKAVNLNVVMFRDRRRGIRRIIQVAEFTPDSISPKANILYRWISEEDKIVKHSDNSRFYEEITKNTGMTQKEMKDNLTDKKKIISWLIENNIRSINDVGRVINYYYSDKDNLMKDIAKNEIKKILGR